jgi:hypothetical protein
MAAQDSTPGYAATAALAYEGPNSLTDWFVPSLFELSSFASTVEGLAKAGYWSSTEAGFALGGVDSAYFMWPHISERIDSKAIAYYVRPIRAF